MSFLTDKPLMVLYEFLEQRCGIMYTPDFQALGRVVDGKLVGVIGFNNFNGASCQMHMAGDTPRWASRGFIETAFRYVFLQRELNMVFALVPSDCPVARQIDLRVGFKELMTLKGAHPAGALHMLCMRRSECRWLERTHGKERKSDAAGSWAAGSSVH